MNGLPPSEFWQMSPGEYWWWYQAKFQQGQTKEEKFEDLYQMLEL